MADRIDVHAHLLPATDDGCKNLEESLECARRMVDAGYGKLVCTPHIWPTYPKHRPAYIAERVAELQSHIDAAGVPLRLYPGGEINLEIDLESFEPSEIPTYANRGRHALFDFWTWSIPDWFWPRILLLQSLGIRPILAHPERIGALWDEPNLVDELASRGVWLQGNLQCLSDPPDASTRRLVELWLLEKRYYMLGSDLHGPASLQVRLEGLERAIQLLGEVEVHRLCVTNPSTLLD